MTVEKRNDSIHRAIVILMALDIVLGASIGAVGYAVLQSPAITLVGAALAVCGIVLLLFFELLGRRGR
jgi:predicted MFS family arabinose efflux permease